VKADDELERGRVQLKESRVGEIHVATALGVSTTAGITA
jgi:hypothetical protein